MDKEGDSGSIRGTASGSVYDGYELRDVGIAHTINRRIFERLHPCLKRQLDKLPLGINMPDKVSHATTRMAKRWRAK